MKVTAVYGVKYYILLVVLFAFTFGFGFFIWLWMRTMWINEADEQGVTTRSGRRFGWDELTDIERTTQTAVGMRIGGIGALIFGKKRVIINTMLLSNAKEVVEFVSVAVGTPVSG